MSQDSPATRADFAAVAEEMRALTRTVAAALSDSRTHSGGRAEIHVNAGGLGLWVAVTCCALMLAALIPMALGLYWVAMDSRDRGHQMNALYQSVPGLRELVDRQMYLIDRTRKAQPEESPP